MPDLRRRMNMAITRMSTRILRNLGLRETIVRRRLARLRTRRCAAESRGDDSLSKPALHELDAKLNRIIDRDDGFFVEAGAHDGYTQSNTYWLERFRGWRGLLVEPMPELAAEARLSRPDATIRQCALVPAEHSQQTVRMHFGDLMSMIDGARESSWPGRGTVLGWRDRYELDVEARTLSSLLDEISAPEVDLLSLDVEGFEGPALRGLDLARHAPRYVLVELHDRDHDRPPVDAVLNDLYLERGWLSPLDLLYVRRDVAQSAVED
jgi:FkbM family methyltransferase